MRISQKLFKNAKNCLKNAKGFSDFLLYFCKRNFKLKFWCQKQNETTMKTSTISQKSQLTPIDFVEL